MAGRHRSIAATQTLLPLCRLIMQFRFRIRPKSLPITSAPSATPLPIISDYFRSQAPESEVIGSNQNKSEVIGSEVFLGGLAAWRELLCFSRFGCHRTKSIAESSREHGAASPGSRLIQPKAQAPHSKTSFPLLPNSASLAEPPELHPTPSNSHWRRASEFNRSQKNS